MQAAPFYYGNLRKTKVGVPVTDGDDELSSPQAVAAGEVTPRAAAVAAQNRTPAL